MAQFPTSPAPNYPYELTQNWKTIVSAFDSGVEQRRQKQTYPKYDVSLVYVNEADDLNILWNFYQARNGSLEAFYFYTIETSDWDGLFVGTGDGSSATFDIPGQSTTSTLIYVNGSLVGSGDYTLLTGGGTEASDRVLFDTAPAANAIITCDFTGNMRIRCRFKEDKMTKQAFFWSLYHTGLELKGLAAI